MLAECSEPKLEPLRRDQIGSTASESALASEYQFSPIPQVELRLEGDSGVLRIEDDGVGFSADKKPDGLGLRTMEYRAAVIKGTLNIDSRSGIGTVVTCSFPIPAEK
jgi:signal transduction histidine kinase